MKKQYGLDELIDILTQARGHLQRGDAAESQLQAQQAESARLDGEIRTKQTELARLESVYSKQAAQADADHQHRIAQLDAEAEARLHQIDQAAQERTETHQRTVQALQQRLTQLKADVAAMDTQDAALRRQLDTLQAALAKARAEAKAFSALVS